jgi:RimJ/RimL family protein N-acetyltransferase
MFNTNMSPEQPPRPMNGEVPVEKTVIPTDKPDLMLQEMSTPDDDIRFWQLQQDNIAHITRHGDEVDKTPADTTVRRLSKHRTRFGIWDSGTLVGMVEYRLGEDNDSQQAELGIVLAEEATNKGYASSSLIALTTYMQQNLHLARIFAEVDVRNQPSLNLFRSQRVGFVEGPEVTRDYGQMIEFDFIGNTPQAYPC